MINARSMVKKVASRIGYDISKKKPKRYICTDDYSQLFFNTQDVFFDIETSITCSLNQFFFDSNKWHYHTKTVEEIIKKPKIDFKNCSLWEFFGNFQPKSIGDYYCISNENKFFTADEREVLNEDINKFIDNSPWIDERVEVDFDKIQDCGLKRSHGVQFYGPVSVLKGTRELQRLKKTYNSIIKYGFQPNKFDGHIRGYFLKYKNNYRFIVVDGQHRMAVLAALKYSKVPVTFHPLMPRIIEYEKLEDFPLVKNGIYSRKLAKKIFKSYFTEDSVAKARKFGLYN